MIISHKVFINEEEVIRQGELKGTLAATAKVNYPLSLLLGHVPANFSLSLYYSEIIFIKNPTFSYHAHKLLRLSSLTLKLSKIL